MHVGERQPRRREEDAPRRACEDCSPRYGPRTEDRRQRQQPGVVLVVGVNGVGKTTTVGKIARVMVADGQTLLLGARIRSVRPRLSNPPPGVTAWV